MFNPGDIIGGDYEILDLVGQGGMGFVYRARQRSLDRIVCLKVPREEVRADETAMARFEREAKTIARLNHPNIVGIYVVHLPKDPEETPYLVMEFVEGKNLEEFIYTHRANLTIGTLLDILRQICDGLQAAHEANIVHRDIKPANIVISSANNKVKIMDFGIARIQSSLDTAATSTMIMGTPAFMSPEQVRGERPTPASDIYSLGAMLYVFCAQRPLFEGTATTVAIKHITEAPPAVRHYNRAVPSDVDELILRCLHKDPRRRPVSAKTLADDFERLLRPIADQPLRTLIPETTSATEALALADDGATWFDPIVRMKVKRLWIGAGVAALVLLAATVVQVVLSEWKPYWKAHAATDAGDTALATSAYLEVAEHPTPSWLPFISRDAAALEFFRQIAPLVDGTAAWDTLNRSWNSWLDALARNPADARSSLEGWRAEVRRAAAEWGSLVPGDAQHRAFDQAVAQREALAQSLVELADASREGDLPAVLTGRASLQPLLPPERLRLLDTVAPEPTPTPTTSPTPSPTRTPAPTPEPGAAAVPTPTPAPPAPTPRPTPSPIPTPSLTPSPSPTSTPSNDPKLADAAVQELSRALLEGPSSAFFTQGFADPVLATRYRNLLNRLHEKQYQLREARHSMLEFTLQGNLGTWKGQFVLRGRLPANVQPFNIVSVPDLRITLAWAGDRWLILDTTLPLEEIAK